MSQKIRSTSIVRIFQAGMQRLPSVRLSKPFQSNLPKDFSRLRIMVVNDNKDAAVSLGMLLKLLGHVVTFAHGDIDALKDAALKSPEVILLDIGMPGMDGYEVARKIRLIPILEKIVLIALTGWGQEEDRRRTLDRSALLRCRSDRVTQQQPESDTFLI